MDPKQQLVDESVDKFASIEKQLSLAHDALMKLSKIWMQGNSLGMMGALETSELTWKTKEVAGIVASAEQALYVLHQRGTAIAQKNNCDIPVIEGGGGGR